MENIEFPLSLLLGILVIANFAYRQLDQPVHVSEKSPLKLLKARMPSEIGSRNFFEAYIYYLCLLLIGYLLLCFSETFYSFVTQSKQSGARTQDFDGSSPVWPLSVALVIIGLSPNFPILKDVERFFRKFAQRSAGIPQNLEAYFEKISSFSFVGLHSDDSYIQKELLKQTNQLCLVLRQSTIKYREAPRIERRILRFFILYYWSVSPNSPIRWRYRSLLQMQKRDLEDKAKKVRGVLNELHREAEGAAWMSAVSNASTVSDTLAANSEDGESDEGPNLGEHADAVNDFSERVKNSVDKYIEPYIEDVEAAFCFLFSNDTRPRDAARDKFYNDPMFCRVREHLLPFNTQTTRNIVAITVFVMAGAVFFLVPLLQLIVTGTSLKDALSQTMFFKAITYTIGTFVLFGSALMGGATFRHVRRETGKFAGFAESPTFPFMQYVGVFVTALTITAILQNCVWMFHAFDAAKSFEQNMFEYYHQQWWSVTAFSLVGALFATVFVAWLQRASEQEYGKVVGLSLRRVALLFSVAFLSALLTMVIFVITAPDASVDVLTATAPGSRLTEIVVAFLATLFGLIAALVQFRSLAKHQVISQ